MNTVVSTILKSLWWPVALVVSSVIYAITMPLTFMMLDDSARSLKDWYS